MTIHTALLEDRGVLRVAGEEAASFLQGLLTNDVESLAVGDARYAALLSPQGKILFDFLVLRAPVESGTAFLIDAPAAQLGDLARQNRRSPLWRRARQSKTQDAFADAAAMAHARDDLLADITALFEIDAVQQIEIGVMGKNVGISEIGAAFGNT